jgi:hypothetical protein
LLLGVLLLLPQAVPAQGVSLVNTTTVNATRLDGQNPTWSADHDFGLVLASRLESFEAFGRGRLVFGTDRSLELHLDEARLHWWPVDGLRLTAGRSLERSGFMQFKSPAEFRLADDPLALGDMSTLNTLKGADLVEVQLSGSFWQFAASIMPLAPVPPFLDSQSPWFPNSLFPSKFTTHFSSYPMTGILIEPAAAPWLAAEPAWQLQGRVLLGNFAFIGGLYNGAAPESLYQAKTRSDGYNGFNIILRPERRPLSAAFFGASAIVGDANLYAEAAYSPARWFARRLDGSRLEFDKTGWSLVDQREVLDTAFGLSTYLPSLRLDLIAEGRWMIIERVVPVLRPMFSTLGTLLLRRSWLDGRVVTTLIAACTPRHEVPLDPETSSYALVLNALWQPAAEFSLALTTPIFWGDPASDLGRYHNLFRPGITATLRQ